MLFVAIAAALVGGMVFMKWAAAPTWAPLYSGLPSEEAANVTTELDAMGVSYKLEGSDTILVSRDLVHQTRLDISAQGTPAAGAPGYALFDDPGTTTPALTHSSDYQRPL